MKVLLIAVMGLVFGSQSEIAFGQTYNTPTFNVNNSPGLKMFPPAAGNTTQPNTQSPAAANNPQAETTTAAPTCTTLTPNKDGSSTIRVGSACPQNNQQNGYNTNDIAHTANGQYGNSYGAAAVTTTEAINYVGQTANTMSQQLGAMHTSSSSQNAQASLAQQAQAGTATSASYAAAQAKSAETAAQTLDEVAVVNSAAAMTDLYRASLHLSAGGVLGKKTGSIVNNGVAGRDTAIKNAQKALVTELRGCGVDEACAKEARTKEQAQEDLINQNANNEMAAQKAAGYKELAVAGESALTAASNIAQANVDRAAAAAALSAGASGFAFSGGSNGYVGGDGTVGAPTPFQGQILNGDTSAANSPSGNSQINPNTDGGVPNTPGGGFVNAPPGGAPGAAAGSPLSTGGTSAAKDDGTQKDNGPVAKTSAGSYSAGDSVGGYSRPGGSAGTNVGLDSFFDMMKSHLPGAETKPAGIADINDRAPASDAAAVIARNKNLFEEVSKRIVKKNAEGAVIFN